MKLFYKMLVTAVTLGLCFHVVTRCLACTTLGAKPVAIASESAVIVWNQSTQTEHFIRTATFDTSDKDFGFVVPTPTIPKLTSVDAAAIPLVNDIMQPTLTGELTDILPFSIFYRLIGSTAKNKLSYVGSSDSGVDIVADQHVGGIDAVTLEASDIETLQHWMKGNGYPWSPDIFDWLQPYVVSKWKITVFKFVKSKPSSNIVASSLLDMSFRTAQPFYPYSEPANQRDPDSYDPQRLLRIFLLSDCRMDAELGQNPESAHWAGMTMSAAPVDIDKLRTLSSMLKFNDTDLPEGTWLTTFDDNSSPRLGYADLYFSQSDSQSKKVLLTVDKRIKHHYFIPIELVALLLLAPGLFGLRRLEQSGKLKPRQLELYRSLLITVVCATYFFTYFAGYNYYIRNL